MAPLAPERFGRHTPAMPQPAIEHVLQFFTYHHLPEPLRSCSAQFADLAVRISQVPDAETTVALRKLLESKDAAVRALVSAQAAERERQLAEKPLEPTQG